MAQRILAKSSKFGFLRQAKSGTPPTAWEKLTAATSNFKTVLNNSKSVTPDLGVNISGFDYLNSGGLLQESNRVYVDKYTGLKKLNFSGYAYKESLADELAAIFQSVVEYSTLAECETVSGSNQIIVPNTAGLGIGQTISMAGVTFGGNPTATITNISTNLITVSGNASTTKVDDLTILDFPKEFIVNNNVIDFNGGFGYLYGVAFQSYAGSSSGDGLILHNAILDSYTLSINNEGTGVEQLLKKDGVWIGNKVSEALKFTGTWTNAPSTPTYYKHFKLNLTIGATQYNNICWKNFSMKFDRAVTPICMVNGVPTNYLTQPAIEITIDIPYTSDNYAIMQAYSAGTNVEFNLTSMTDGIPNSYHGNNLTIQGNSGILKSNPFQYDGEYLSLRLVFDLMKPANGSLIPTVIFADSILGGF